MRTNTANSIPSTSTLPEAPMSSTSTSTPRKGKSDRKPAPRPEQLAAANTSESAEVTTAEPKASTEAPAPKLSHADNAIAIASGIPVADYAARLAATTDAARPALTPEAQARLEKERNKLAKEQKAAASRARRIEALERGEALPTSSKGLPPVVKMNELGALARQLHRATVLAASVEAVELMRTAGIGGGDVTSAVYALGAATDEAIRCWSAQYQQRLDAGAADNDTLHPLGLVRDEETGAWKLVEKTKATAAAA